MPIFRVTVVERTTKYWTAEIEADTEDDARTEAEGDEWTEAGGWEEAYDRGSVDCGIEEIEDITDEKAQIVTEGTNGKE